MDVADGCSNISNIDMISVVDSEKESIDAAEEVAIEAGKSVYVKK